MGDRDRDAWRGAMPEDVPWRTALPLTAVFAAIVFGIALVPWSLGHPWLWNHFRLVGAIASLVFFGATQPLWMRKAIEDRTNPDLTRYGDPEARFCRRLRAARWRWWMTFVFVVVLMPLGLLAMFLSGPSTDNGDGVTDVSGDAKLIASQPHQVVPVTAVELIPADDVIDVQVRIDGGTEGLANSHNLARIPRVGDRIAVVTDPINPAYVIGVDVKGPGFWESEWTISILFVLVTALIGYQGWRSDAAPRLAVKAARRNPSRVATVVSIRDGDRMSEMVIRTDDGHFLLWPLKVSPIRRPEAGDELTIRGDLEPGGWAAAVFRRWVLWSARPLTASTGLAPITTGE